MCRSQLRCYGIVTESRDHYDDFQDLLTSYRSSAIAKTIAYWAKIQPNEAAFKWCDDNGEVTFPTSCAGIDFDTVSRVGGESGHIRGA